MIESTAHLGSDLLGESILLHRVDTETLLAFGAVDLHFHLLRISRAGQATLAARRSRQADAEAC